MLFRLIFRVSSICPKTGKYLGPKKKYRWLRWVFPIAGLLALIWFFVRVIPKPTRATYPCQKVAAGLAGGFLVWAVGVIGSVLASRKAKRCLNQSRYALAVVCAGIAVMAIWLPLALTSSNSAKAFTPTDPANTPVGEAKGINPGRVVWVRDPYATNWDGFSNPWWDDNNTDQNSVDCMVTGAIQGLTGQSDDPNAWDRLFRHFNQTKGKGDVGYQSGEKIVVKINENNQNNPLATENVAIDASPHMVRGLLRQLVNQAGVPQAAIIVYDATRPISDPVYNYCYPEFPDVDYRSGHGYPNILSPNFTWVSNAITYSQGYADPNGRNIPQCVLDAEYMINMAILKKHSMNAAGVTLCFKNLFGNIGCTNGLHDQGYWQSSWGMDAYDLLVDIMGHESIGGKTVLFMIDGLYGSNAGVCEAPTKWVSQPFDNDWPSSIFVSQDPVAIDSVGLDLLRTESTLLGNADNYLHEAAEANSPPSGTVYDPEDDGTPLASLGVHEHWNNSTDRQYSRNLGTGDGIELVKISTTVIGGDFDEDRDVDYNDLDILTGYWLDGSYPEQGLVGYWRLDDNSGVVAVDSSGNGNNGNVVGDPNWVIGRIGGALDFNGLISNRVEISEVTGMSASAGTVALWVYLSEDQSSSDVRYIFGHNTFDPTANRIQLYMDGGDTGLDLGLAGNHTVRTNIVTLSTQAWYHIILTWDGTAYAVYINGQPTVSGTFTGLSDTGTVNISNNPANPTKAVPGIIDEVAIYDRALSASEIRDEIFRYYLVDSNHDGMINMFEFAVLGDNWLVGSDN